MDEITNAAEMQQIEETCCEISSVVAVLPEKKEWYQTVSLEDAKAFIKANIMSAARNFNAVGYYLKHIRDNELFREEGYATIGEFAQVEFGISKSTASRYMKMNDRFSKDGNSPFLDEKYKSFDKSKLQEMLLLTDEQLEQVTPDMKVQQIREMRKPKEVPYYEMEGQMEFEMDFPEIMPDPEANLPVQSQTFTMDVSDMFAGDPIEPAGDPMIQEPVAISQQPEKTGLCLHRPQFPCTLAEEDKQVAGDGADCTHSCCWDCPDHGKCRLECYASAQRPEPELPKEQQKPENAAEIAAEPEEKQDPMSDHSFRERHCNALARKMIQCWKPWFEQDFQNRVLNVTESEKQIKEKNNRSSNRTWYFPGPDGEMMHVNMFDGYIQFWESECLGNCDWFYLCAAIQRMWQEMAMEEARKRFEQPIDKNDNKQQEPDPEVIDAEFTEIKPAEKYTPRYFLEKEKKLLDEMTEVFKDEKPENIPQEMYAHKKIVVAALAAMVRDLENEEIKKQMEEEKPQQPELPKLKNNDQRAAFVDAYATWPIWIETRETGERYYRYELPDAAMVVKVYFHKCFDYNAPAGKWEDRFHDDWGNPEYYLMQDEKHFKDCQTNRSALIDYLKEIQKKGENMGRLTEKDECGNWCLKGVAWSQLHTGSV